MMDILILAGNAGARMISERNARTEFTNGAGNLERERISINYLFSLRNSSTISIV